LAVVDVTIVPVGTASASLSEFVAGCLEVLQGAEGISYQLTPMSTVIEGELGRVFEVIRQMHEVPFIKGACRVVTTIRVDDRRDKVLTAAGKVAAVKAKLGK
jgi:uncharacterized protein (TIGR00106 family)